MLKHVLAAATALTAVALCPGAQASSYKVIHAFAGPPNDGRYPSLGLVSDSAGNLYGITAAGGANDDGTVFELTPPKAGQVNWTETILHSFTGSAADGSFPAGTLVMDRNGALYGVTFYGGTVFKLTPPAVRGGAWKKSVIATFSFDALPNAGLVMDAEGALYGTIGPGSPAAYGSVFKLAPPATAGGQWAKTTLYSFKGAPDGASPTSPLTLDAAGNLYGTTEAGGADGTSNGGYGTVFRLTRPSSTKGTWTEQVLHSFNAGGEGTSSFDPLIINSSGGTLRLDFQL